MNSLKSESISTSPTPSVLLKPSYYYYYFLNLMSNVFVIVFIKAMGTGGSFPGGKARLGRDADHSPPSSAEVENE
jgi:hypothetical protein